MLEVLTRPPTPRAGADVLEAWDDKVAAASRGAVLFQRFWDLLFRVPCAARSRRRGRRPIRRRRRAASPTRPLPSRTWQPPSAPSASSTDRERVAWGEVNRFRAGALDLPGDGATGTYGTYRVMTFAAQSPGSAAARRRAHRRVDATPVGFGDGWVLLVDFSKPGEAWSVLAYGQTTKPGLAPQQRSAAAVRRTRLRRAWYSEADIKANLERSYRP